MPVRPVSGNRFASNMISTVTNRGKRCFMLYREMLTTHGSLSDIADISVQQLANCRTAWAVAARNSYASLLVLSAL